ncbi:hypothetical protein D16iCDA_05590 [Pseudomonas seleniipraecipitans]|uniref:Uncharacterized protein n=1 Tax=Phytopseudomonas seleniipraecipitans TaxID=640205 RepID=A0ABY5JAR3_9GAMM|nr:hypothetical protein [Pseudomonas seleniipraecipitans]UUD65146.1 hypothetical protein D16iCDA_05590 [Pseudomonas seleniipraecipitans]
MRIEKDDVPDYLKPRKKQGPWRTLAVMGMGSAIFWGLVTVFAKPIVIDVAQLKQAIRFGGEPIFSQQPAQSQQATAEALQGNDQDWIRSSQAQQTIQANRELEEWSRQRAQETQERQTVFNDNNYAPKQPVNTYKPTPAPVQQIASVEQPRQQQRTVQRERTSRWIKNWNGGTNYLAEWISVNNHIDGTTVCANHKRGSIDYRECRKAAKQHYHEECRTWRSRYSEDRKDRSDRMRERYCGAASGFNPMG